MLMPLSFFLKTLSALKTINRSYQQHDDDEQPLLPFSVVSYEGTTPNGLNKKCKAENKQVQVFIPLVILLGTGDS